MLTNKTVSDLLDSFASPAPTPGGGSASALAGAVGASLLAMVASMPKTKTNSPEDRAALDVVKPTLTALRHALADLVDRDAAAYDTVVAAFRLPKATDEDKTARTAAIQAATRLATDVPLETMRACAKVIREARIVSVHGNKSASSDVKVALHLAMAGLHGARHNVEINLASLTDAAAVSAIKQELDSMTSTLGEEFHAAFPKDGH